VLQASHVHELDRLKTKCLRFIIDNYDSCRPEKVCVCVCICVCVCVCVCVCKCPACICHTHAHVDTRTRARTHTHSPCCLGTLSQEPSIREAMRKHPSFFDLIMSALAPGPAAQSRAAKAK